MNDPIDLAMKRAAEPRPEARIQGQMPLPSGKIAFINVPRPLSAEDALVMIGEIAKLPAMTIEQTPEQQARSRLVLPS
jgi:hypothetical protein